MDSTLPVSKLAPLVFMMGPVGATAIFPAVTREADDPLRRRIAPRAVLVAGAAIGLAVFLGIGGARGMGHQSGRAT